MMSDERIGTAEAARMMRCALSHARDRARTNGWDVLRTTRAHAAGGVRLLFLKSDVEEYVARKKAFKKPLRPSKADETRKLVKWANELPGWPTDAHIEKMTSDVYRFKDVEGVIDTRVFRLKDPQPVDKTKDKYLKALRKPAMKREGAGRRHAPRKHSKRHG